MLDFFYAIDDSNKTNCTEKQVGVDEAGRGCFAGPVTAGAVVWDVDWLINNKDKYKEISMIKDSKKLSAKARKQCYDFITAHCSSYAISHVSNGVIDELNILQSTYKAMHDALDKLETSFDRIVVDGSAFKAYLNKREDSDLFVVPHVCITNGDNIYFSIACASILAKVSRDMYIEELCNHNPIYQDIYDWKNNKCYGTKKHIEAIKEHGLTPLHRRTFGLCKHYPVKTLQTLKDSNTIP